MKYKVFRTDIADAQIRKIIIYVAQNFGKDVANKKLKDIQDRIMDLSENPYIGIDPKYLILKRQQYKILIIDKNLVFYKIYESERQVIVYAVIDQRQDYLNIILGL